MDIFDIFAAASFEYAVYSNLAATDPHFENQNGDPYFEMEIAKKQVPILKRGSPIRKLKW